MSYILNRNVECYISNSDTAPFNAANTDQILILDGFQVEPSNNTTIVNRKTIDPSENRGLTVFSESDNPVDFQFSTHFYAGKPTSQVEINTRKAFQGLAGYTGSYTEYTTRAEVLFTSSDIARLLNTTIWFTFPNLTYRVDNAVFTRATIDIALDRISTIDWKGSGTGLTTFQSYNPPTASTDTTPYKSCILNKFTEITLSIGSISYTVNLIGGSIDIENDVSFIKRDILGEYSIISDHYTGDRSITGTLDFYLKAIGAVTDTADLFDFLYTNKNYLEDNLADITISIGGSGVTPRVDILMPSVYLELPNLDFDQVVSTTIPFTALESSPGEADEITIKYYL